MIKIDVPWWTYGAIDEIERWLSARSRPVRVFEYGSGASTVWLARRSDEVYSVEHQASFAANMAPILDPLVNVDLLVVEPQPSEHADVPSAKEGHRGLDFAGYVNAINRVEGPFDLVVVDGRAREACLAAAKPRLSPEGVIVFDNSARRRYRPAIAASGLAERRFRGLVPTLPYPDQTSVLSTPVR
jgi:predicted O-methyltransferase YrrM